tara:strand:+ start:267 stop:824 length:558 start_codon:yes stop_codon:yes gene_type:complete
MIDFISEEARERMVKSVDALSQSFNRIRTGRAHPSLLDGVKVECYGTESPLNQVASVNVEDARTLTLNVWDRTVIPEVERAILKSELGLNPVTAGEVVRIPMPSLTEETRRVFIKQARSEAESARVSIRNARRDAIANLKNSLKEKEISEDEERRAEDLIQKLTDEFIATIEQALEQKEADLLEI